MPLERVDPELHPLVLAGAGAVLLLCQLAAHEQLAVLVPQLAVFVEQPRAVRADESGGLRHVFALEQLQVGAELLRGRAALELLPAVGLYSPEAIELACHLPHVRAAAPGRRRASLAQRAAAVFVATLAAAVQAAQRGAQRGVRCVDAAQPRLQLQQLLPAFGGLRRVCRWRPASVGSRRPPTARRLRTAPRLAHPRRGLVLPTPRAPASGSARPGGPRAARSSAARSSGALLRAAPHPVAARPPRRRPRGVRWPQFFTLDGTPLRSTSRPHISVFLGYMLAARTRGDGAACRPAAGAEQHAQKARLPPSRTSNCCSVDRASIQIDL